MNLYQVIDRIDRAYDTLFRIGRVRIELTKTNKELTKIEEDYVPKIHRIFKKIVSEYGSTMEKSYMLHDAEKKYGNEIRAIIKSMTTKTYLLGMEYVSRAMNKPELIYLTSTDLLNINLKADDGYRMFWRLVNKYLQVIRNKTMNIIIKRVAATGAASLDYLDTMDVTLMDEVLTSSDEEDMRLLDTRTNAALITNAILTPVLAYSTIENYKQAKQQMQLIDKEVQAERQLFGEGDYLSSTDLDQVEGDEDATVVFATEKDSKVCDICQSLEGMEWSINDPEIITPVVDTHPNCRCRLLLRINGEIMAK